MVSAIVVVLKSRDSPLWSLSVSENDHNSWATYGIFFH